MASAKPIVIVGAGPAGLTAAWQLIHAGREIVLWDADASYVGGNSRTVQAEGYRIDMGGHLFFSKSEEINEIWRRIMVDEFTECQRVSRIYYKGKFLNEPFEATKAVRTLGLVETAKIRASIFRAKARQIAPETTFAQWVTNRYGQRLFETFFKPYTEKVWGVPCDQLSADCAALPLDGLSLAEAFETGTDAGSRRPPIRTFFYPHLGPGQMWEIAANKVLEKNGPIFLDRKLQTVHWDDSGVTHITGTNKAGEFFQQEGSHFLAGIPLRELMLSLDPPPPKEVSAAARALRYRDFITVCLIVKRDKVFPDNWIYIQDPSVKVARVQNYKNWSAGMVPEANVTSLGMEYFCFEGDALWSATDYDLAQLAIREVAQLGLVQESEIKDAFVVRMPKAYPIYDLHYLEHLHVIKAWVSLFFNLQPMGRSGMHNVNNQDHAMMTALLAVRNIQGGDFDCWKVDTDAAYIKDSRKEVSS